LSNHNLVYAVEATALQAGMPAVQSVDDSLILCSG